MNKIKIFHIFIALLLSYSSLAKGSCLDTLKILVTGKRVIQDVDTLHKYFPLTDRAKSLFDSYSEAEQKTIYEFFSQIRGPNRFMNVVLFRKGAIKDIVEIVIEHKTQYSELFVRGLENYYALNRTQKRALHLMLHKKWWFEGIFFKERNDLAGIDSFFDFVRPSYYFDQYLAQNSTKMGNYLNRILKSGFISQITHRFGYMKELHGILVDTANTTGFKQQMMDMRADKVIALKAAKTDKEKKKIEKEIAHLNNVIRLMTKENFHDYYKRRFPTAGQIGYSIGKEMEDFAIVSAKLYVVFYLLSEYLTIDNINHEKATTTIVEKKPGHILERDRDQAESDAEKLLRYCNDPKHLQEKVCQDLIN